MKCNAIIAGLALLLSSTSVSQANPQLLAEYSKKHLVRVDPVVIPYEGKLELAGASMISHMKLNGHRATICHYDVGEPRNYGPEDYLAITFGDVTILDQGIDGIVDQAFRGSDKLEQDQAQNMYKFLQMQLLEPYFSWISA